MYEKLGLPPRPSREGTPSDSIHLTSAPPLDVPKCQRYVVTEYVVTEPDKADSRSSIPPIDSGVLYRSRTCAALSAPPDHLTMSVQAQRRMNRSPTSVGPSRENLLSTINQF
ncbi:hypothetical protein MRX96_005818 [Rhipicephalus microplus]